MVRKISTSVEINTTLLMKFAHGESYSRLGPLWLRFSVYGVGILILMWLPIEDSNEVTAIIFGLLISGIFSLRLTLVRQQSKNLLRITLIGLLAGLVIVPIALILIAFKTGLHSHGIPDFPANQILSMLGRIPLFALGGLFLGLGSGFWVSARNSYQNM